MNRRPVVSSLSMAFKKAVDLSDDLEVVKKEHRTNLKTLMDRYMDDVKAGKAEGIRTARELVELIKADMLLLGEATERTDEMSAVDQAKIARLSKVIDVEDQAIQDVMKGMFDALNSANDDYDRLETEGMLGKVEQEEPSKEEPYDAEEEISQDE